jgi:voltage-gated potassium channel
VPVLATLVRAARLARGTRLITVVGSVNRAMGALRRSMSRRGLGYVVVLTLLVTVAGAAGMYAFERSAPNAPGLPDFPTALWWTAMIMTTLGSDYWPHTAEGRTLCLLLSIYAFAVWGYITAALATFFVGRDADNDDAELAGQKSIEALRADIAGLRAEVRALGPVRGEGTAR